MTTIAPPSGLVFAGQSLVFDSDALVLNIPSLSHVDKNAAAVLSGNDLTAAGNGTDGWARGEFLADGDKLYFEATCVASGIVALGVMSEGTFRITDTVGTGGASSVPGAGRSGRVWWAPSAAAVGDVVQLCYDRSTGKVWVRINAGAWTSSGNPVTGAGGTGSTSALPPELASYPLLGVGNGASATINLTGPFAYTPPTGFEAFYVLAAADVVRTPAAGTGAVVGSVPAVAAAASVAPGVGSAVYAGLAPSVAAAAGAAPGVGALLFGSFHPTVVLGETEGGPISPGVFAYPGRAVIGDRKGRGYASGGAWRVK